MNKPWKCKEVDWFPRLFFAVMKTLSPTSATMGGIGHWPLIPMVGLSNAPSGFDVTHSMLKSYVTVLAVEKPKIVAVQATGKTRRLNREDIVKPPRLEGDG